MLSLFRRWTLGRLLRQPLPESQLAVLRKHVPVTARLSPQLRRRHEQIVSVMLARCHWEGCEGLLLTEDMRTRIAGHAAVMLLGAEDYYFESVSAILIFPRDIRRSGEGQPSVNLGEAWANGGVVLSWPEVLRVGDNRDGHNVIIHEFAHHLDGLDGEMGGSIPFKSGQDQARWDRVSAEEFERLASDVRHGRPTWLDPYGATDPAEFFAVCSEAFFEQPHRMQQTHAELFELLQRFYRCDPRQWQTA